MIFQKIAEKIKKADKIAIFSHTRPDGDTVGGVLALKKGLESIGKKCACFCDNAIPSRFSFLPGVGDYSLSPAEKYDLYIAVDCGELARLGENAVFFQKKVNTVNIDHHGSNDNFAEINYVAGYASTCEIVFELLDYMKISLD
ncbi:MAG TPA: DHH family phosphoesterase, partial [Firmicutes bacterium]|nr:DHH family phosphoesterase [Bacillota bacterium]